MEINADKVLISRCEVQTIEDITEFPRAVLHVECVFAVRHPVAHVYTDALKGEIHDALQDAVFFDAGDAETDEASPSTKPTGE